MRVQTRRIAPEGIILKESFPLDIIEEVQTDAFRFIAPVETEAKIFGVEDDVVATITTESRFKSFCSRCLEEIERDWKASFTISFDVKEYADFIEMDEDIRQELILNLPVRVLCEADCKGLCMDCGANLNKQDCKHQHAVPSDQ